MPETESSYVPEPSCATTRRPLAESLDSSTFFQTKTPSCCSVPIPCETPLTKSSTESQFEYALMFCAVLFRSVNRLLVRWTNLSVVFQFAL